MLTNEMKTLIEDKMVKILEGNLEFIGRGYARKVYDLNDEYVMKVERKMNISTLNLNELRFYNREMYEEREMMLSFLKPLIFAFGLEKKQECGKNDTAISNYFKYLKLLKLEASEETLDRYYQYRMHEFYDQNIHDYVNYLTIKDSQLGEYIPECLGIMYIGKYSIVVQEKGTPGDKVINADWSALKNKITDVVKKFSDKGYMMNDISIRNIILTSDNKIKISDSGCCDFSGLSKRS